MTSVEIKLPSDWEVPEFQVDLFSQKSSTYAVLIPVLNEKPRISPQLPKMKKSTSLDIFLVDGGSVDGTTDFEFLKNNQVTGLIKKLGPGKLSAQMRAGLAVLLSLGYEGIVLIDGNDKDDPNAISKFEEYLERGYDHIQGSRFVKGGVHERTPIARLLAIKLIHAPLMSLKAGFRYTDTTNGFRAYSKRLLTDSRVQPFRDIFKEYELHYYLALAAPRLGFKTIEIPVKRSYPSGEIPTKIKGWKGNFKILVTLFKCLFDFYKVAK